MIISLLFISFFLIKFLLFSFNSALSDKWKEKSDLINELDNKIRRASENYQLNEKKILEENKNLIQKNKFGFIFFLYLIKINSFILEN